jgi:hypothetical protein
MRAIAVRGFINDKLDTTSSRTLFRKALFNGSVELRDPNQKYLVDYFTYPQWELLARSDRQLEVAKELRAQGFDKEPDYLFSWMLHYDPLTKTKTRVDGYSIYSSNTKELYIKINDAINQTTDDWELNVCYCKAVGKNKPVFIASNCELITQE